MRKLLVSPRARILLWIRMLHRLHGVTIGDKIALLLSAIADVAQCILHPSTVANPICKFSCTVYAPEFNAYFHVRKNSDDLYSVLPYREGDAHEAILGPLSEGDVFIDVGANVGYYSILASKRVGLEGHVIAIEPFPDTVKQLKKNIESNCAYNIEVIDSAAWSETGKKLVLDYIKGFWGQVKVAARAQNIDDRDIVTTVRIDDICKVYPKIKVLKIDVEGGEYEVLKGAKETLSKTQFVIIEISENEEHIVEFLTEMGFQLKKLNFTTYYSGIRKATR